jgi:hypothetical protein
MSVCVCACVLIGNVKFSTSDTNSPQTGYYLQEVTLTLLPLIAIDTEQTDGIITHIHTDTQSVSRQHKLSTDMQHFMVPPSSRRQLSSSGLLHS